MHVFHDPGGDRRGETQGEPDAEIDDGKSNQLLDQAVLDAEIEDRQETANNDDVDDAHSNFILRSPKLVNYRIFANSK